MKRLSFIKFLLACPVAALHFFGLSKPTSRNYLNAVRIEETVGLRFEWEGVEWVIIDKMPVHFEWEGQSVTNYLMNKYLAVPSEPLAGGPKLYAFYNVRGRLLDDGSGHEVDLGLWDLSGCKFYKV